MHSSFPDLRSEMPMNCRRAPKAISASAACLQDIQRVQQIWRDCRTQFGQNGPWLFGDFSLADCMYAPVVMRFSGYAVELDAVAQQYVATMLAHPALQEWIEASRAEPEVIDAEEVD